MASLVARDTSATSWCVVSLFRPVSCALSLAVEPCVESESVGAVRTAISVGSYWFDSGHATEQSVATSLAPAAPGQSWVFDDVGVSPLVGVSSPADPSPFVAGDGAPTSASDFPDCGPGVESGRGGPR